MRDPRGSFRELWRAGDFPDEPFVQANLSTSAAGVLRGLHLHRRQDDLWIVADGRAFVALVDLRPMLDGSGTAPLIETRELRRRRLGRHPDRDRPRVPGARSAPARSTWSPTSTTAPTSSASPGTIRPSRSTGRRSRGPPTDARSCRSVTARTRPWPSSWCGSATAAPDPDRTSPPGSLPRPTRRG